MTPASTPPRSAQPARTALRLSIEDEARTLRFQLQHGARWLLRDLRAGVGKLEALQAPGTGQLPKLQHFVESAAEATGFMLQTAQNAASVAAPDAAYRTLHFKLLPLAAYFNNGDKRNPSRQFTQVFSTLIRHALDAGPASELLVRQRLVDEAYWTVLDRSPDLVLHSGSDASGGDARDQQLNLSLCALLLEVLVQTRPVYDGSLPPWADRDLQDAKAAAAFPDLVAAVVAVGLPAHAHQGSEADASERLGLATQLVKARLSNFEAAVSGPDSRDAFALELAFVFRHV